MKPVCKKLFVSLIAFAFLLSPITAFDFDGSWAENRLSNETYNEKLDGKGTASKFLDGDWSLEYLNGDYVAEKFLDAGYIAENYIDRLYIAKLIDGNREDLILSLDGDFIPVSKILRNIGVAEGVMLVAAIAFSAVPGAQPFTAIIITMHVEALAAAAIDASISGVITYVSSQGDITKTVGKVLESASSGYMWGAVFAAGGEAVNTAKIIHKNTKTVKTAKRVKNTKDAKTIAEETVEFSVAEQTGRKVVQKTAKKSITEITTQMGKSAAKKEAKRLLGLPGIKLTTRQMDLIRQNPNFLKELVAEFTQKSFSDGYLEFFIRLSKQQPKQFEQIWNYSQAVRNIIKNEGIRAGGVHEWLMCENFCDFLLTWGREDGAYLATILPKLTQPTNEVVMNGIYKGWTHEMEVFGRGPIHTKIRETIKNSHSASELLYNMDIMVKENFTEETYKEFSRALAECLK